GGSRAARRRRGGLHGLGHRRVGRAGRPPGRPLRARGGAARALPGGRRALRAARGGGGQALRGGGRRRARAHRVGHGPGRAGLERRRRRGHHGGPRGQARRLPPPRPRAGPARAHRLEHVLHSHRPARGSHAAARPRPGPALLLARPGHAARRGRRGPGDQRGHRRARGRARRPPGQDADQDEGPLGLRRELPPRAVPHGRRADVRGGLRRPGGHRRGDGPGLRAPDGAAGPVRLHRPGRRPGDLGGALRRVPRGAVRAAAAAAADGRRGPAGPQDGARVLRVPRL
ncbi:MAG: 3-hydroxybutyryl-CoA dehydrogenase; 3-hydroxyacyl-CoA dehydrogenase, partial [uncultured Solirubrobacteraceae bacterium]